MASGISVKTQNEGKSRGTGNLITGESLPNKQTALHVINKGTVTSIGSDAIDSIADNVITAASHAARAGDLIRMTSGAADGLELRVFAVDTNTISLESDGLAIDPSAADTFEILRGITPTLSSTGGSASIVTFVRDASNQEVTKDTATPANNRGLPVEIVGSSGATINITAGDIGVELSHASDSTQIGNGTNLMAVNASLEAQVRDDDANTTLSTIAGDTTSLDAKMPALGAAASAASVPVNIASDQTVPVSAASLPLPSGAATSALQTSSEALLTTLAGAVAGTEMQVDVVGALPAGSNVIGSVNISAMDCVDFLDVPFHDASVTNIPASSTTPVTVVASLAAAVQKVQISDTTGEFIGLYSDPAGTPVLEAIFGPGSDSTVEVQLPASTVIGLRNMQNATISAGALTINFMG